MKKLIFITAILFISFNTFAGRKLFSTAPSSLGMYLPLNTGSGWTTAGNLDFTIERDAEVSLILNLDSKLETCTGSCPSPGRGGSLMADLRIVNTATNALVYSRRGNGGMAILSGGTSGVLINHMLVIPVSLTFATNVLPPGNYRATVQVQNATAYNMQFGFRQLLAQVFEQ